MYIQTETLFTKTKWKKTESAKEKDSIQKPIRGTSIAPIEGRRLSVKFLKAADILVLPNVPTSEESVKYTSPVKLFEYMASGVPIIASDLPSIREILNEQNAILVRADDPAALAEDINKVLQDNELSNSISKQALIDVKDHTWENRAQKIIDFLDIDI